MPKALLFTVVLSLALLVTPVLAGNSPPPDAMPLSQIIQMLEQRDDLAYFDEIEWDDDGYWEVEYVTPDGRKREVKVDPVSGQVRGD